MGCICKDEAKINTRDRQNITNTNYQNITKCETSYFYKQNPQTNINNPSEIKKEDINHTPIVGYPQLDEDKKPEQNKKQFNNSKKNDLISNGQEDEDNNQILEEEIFYDGNSENYDLILNFESFEQLKKGGWTAYFSQEGWKKYKESIDNENLIIGVVGIKNRGKSYLLKRIMDSKNYQANDGFLVTTYGISCGFPVLKDKNKYQTFITLDTAGRDNPLLQNVYSKEQDVRSIIKDQKVCEILLSDFIMKECNILIAVVEQLSFAEQEMIISLTERLRLKELYNNIDKRKLIIIHNLMNINKTEDIETFVKDTLLKSMTFKLETHFIEDHQDKKYNLTVYDQMIENDNSKLDIVHVVIGNDKVKEVREKYNEPAFKYIRDYIKIDEAKKFDILESFKEFIKDNYKKFINTNLFENNPLQIGKKKSVKVYTDKEKNNKVDKIIKNIGVKNKNKIKEFTFKSFFFSGGIYYSTEPLYSAKIIDKKYLEIVFEMYGKLNSITTDVNYDDNNNKIIIEIRGKTEEFELDFFKKEEKIGKEIGNLKYSEFDFQVIIDKYETIKNHEIEIENKNIKPELDEDVGLGTFLFPINIFEI